MNIMRSFPEHMNDADFYAMDLGYLWGLGEPCPECGAEVWTKTTDIHEGEVVEWSTLCSNCGYQAVSYDT